MKLETDRLEMVLLTPDEQLAWANNSVAAQNKYKCSYKAEPMEPWFADILRAQCEKYATCTDRWVWHGFFWLIRKSDRTVVGSFDFKREPDENGYTEIGYGLGEEWRGRGYMSEAVEEACRWALSQPDVKGISAETEPDNTASAKVLRRCGFAETGRDKYVSWLKTEESREDREIRLFWQRFLRAAGLSPDTKLYEDFYFDVTEKSANHLLQLVLEGKKRATSSAYPCYEIEREPLPKAGDYSVVTDFHRKPYCVIETVAVSIIPFDKMTFDICSREGEDECLETWQEKHRRFFTADAKEVGYTFTESMPVVFEDFRVIYKEEH